MTRRSTVVVTCLLVLLAARANAQEAGVRAGASADPSQFYLGVHYESAPLVENLRFRPNMEVGFGDNVTLIALNFEFAYHIPLKTSSAWGLYVGAGPALNIYTHDDDTNPEGGFNILLGLQHSRGLFTEIKVGAIDSPGFKFGVGYTFGR